MFWDIKRRKQMCVDIHKTHQMKYNTNGMDLFFNRDTNIYIYTKETNKIVVNFFFIYIYIQFVLYYYFIIN